MGYCIQLKESNVKILKENFDKVLEIIKSFPCDSYSWVGDFKTCDTLQKALREWRWFPSYDQEGNINNLQFTGEKKGDDDFLFHAIGPYVEKDSYILLQGEDGKMFLFEFNGQNCIERETAMLWEDDLAKLKQALKTCLKELDQDNLEEPENSRWKEFHELLNIPRVYG